MTLQSIVYDPGSPPQSKPSLKIINQLLLPHRTVYVPIRNARCAFSAIKQMLVRGAPAIALVAALAIAVEDPWGKDHEDISPSEDINGAAELEYSAPPPPPGHLSPASSPDDAANWYASRLTYLVESRPTAVNLADAARKLSARVRNAVSEVEDAAGVSAAYVAAAAKMLEDDVRDNEHIGRAGRDWLRRTCQITEDHPGSVLTHCNTGSLATAGYGTALGIIRSLHGAGLLRRAYYTETRPYNQGSRLTGYELLHDSIPATLITDSMAASLFQLKSRPENIVAVIVGADRVAANGDTANKIGTYALACLARQHGIRFVVAAPRTTIDLNTPSGDDIVIEERPQHEVLAVKGPVVTSYKGDIQQVDADIAHNIGTAAPGTKAWNPAFDVTPADLIDVIVSEVGVVEKRNGRFSFQYIFEPNGT